MTEAARRYGLGAFAHRNFRLFFIGQGISLVGTWMQNVGEGWLILTLTNSPFYVGLTSALSSLGVLLFSLYAGVIADRVDKRQIGRASCRERVQIAVAGGAGEDRVGT